jgi:hypothetical protein
VREMVCEVCGDVVCGCGGECVTCAEILSGVGVRCGR